MMISIMGLALQLLLCLSCLCHLVHGHTSSTSNALPPQAQAALKPVDFDAILMSRLQLNSTSDQGTSAGGSSGKAAAGAGKEEQTITLAGLVKTVEFILELPQNLNISFNRVPELRKRSFWAVIALCQRLQHDALSRMDELGLLNQLDEQLQQLPNHLCWPIARRVVFASLVQRRLVHGPFSPEAQIKVRDLCVRLYRLHQQAAARKGVIDFFHVSKVRQAATRLDAASDRPHAQSARFLLRAACRWGALFCVRLRVLASAQLSRPPHRAGHFLRGFISSCLIHTLSFPKYICMAGRHALTPCLLPTPYSACTCACLRACLRLSLPCCRPAAHRSVSWRASTAAPHSPSQ